jgi:hypothetical protein
LRRTGAGFSLRTSVSPANFHSTCCSIFINHFITDAIHLILTASVNKNFKKFGRNLWSIQNKSWLIFKARLIFQYENGKKLKHNINYRLH